MDGDTFPKLRFLRTQVRRMEARRLELWKLPRKEHGPFEERLYSCCNAFGWLKTLRAASPPVLEELEHLPTYEGSEEGLWDCLRTLVLIEEEGYNVR